VKTLLFAGKPKTRPEVVIQNDTANRWSPITIVAAISSRRDDPRYPTEVNVAPPEGGLRAILWFF
jgi:mRNA interferase MazF